MHVIIVIVKECFLYISLRVNSLTFISQNVLFFCYFFIILKSLGFLHSFHFPCLINVISARRNMCLFITKDSLSMISGPWRRSIYWWHEWSCCCCSSLVTKSCLTLVTPWMLACQTALTRGFSRQKMLEWVAIPFSRGSSWPRIRTSISCIVGQIPYPEQPGKPKHCHWTSLRWWSSG